MKKRGNPRKKSKSRFRNKASAQTRHAIGRAEERYGLNVSDSDLRCFVNTIQSGNAVHLESQSNRTSVFAVNTSAGDIPMVYDKQRKTIVTMLPEEYYNTGSKRWFDDWDD